VGDGFATEIQACQRFGKKVLISLGGAADYSDLSIPNEQAAADLARTLWNLFLGGADSSNAHIRPYGGNIILDGIDLGKFMIFPLFCKATFSDNLIV
jgi:chitinase